jgi:hypothetical protein
MDDDTREKLVEKITDDIMKKLEQQAESAAIQYEADIKLKLEGQIPQWLLVRVLKWIRLAFKSGYMKNTFDKLDEPPKLQ